jgi:hypothetical protein
MWGKVFVPEQNDRNRKMSPFGEDGIGFVALVERQ